ncbi:hypothetical protein Ddye_007428 [Dipteronia dyeriana]|uniref:non-specific serine/threonine protein kinase n=1 Tax=Dipteronia dyeriana TaxID=168575 RepID=A0AAE0CRG5_9ROSI|nr:hypothetical protein Ddye_007428 [Dipteronia dyeriana]
MGNCFGSTSVNISQSQCTSKPPSREETDEEKRNGFEGISPEKGKIYNNNNNTQVDAAATARTADVPSSGKVVTPNLKMFTLQELKQTTKNFRPNRMLGEGGFEQVFKGWVDEKTYGPTKAGTGIAVAVKKSNPYSPQELEEWRAEVKFLGKFSHPNLVKLIGYCCEDKQLFLVYEYMAKGSLENHLFRRGAEPLAWNIRLKIAIDAAKGLNFLHSSEKSVIYRDFKASNILLDGAYNAKLSNFGLAKFGPINGNSHITTRVMGTYGYAAPEYIATGHLYVKSDVYGFGVVLLEMLTGLRALDQDRPTGEVNLVEWAVASLENKKRLKKIMDPRLNNKYPMEAAIQAAKIIKQCLQSDPKNRPSMDKILETLEQVNAIQENPKKKSCSTKTKPNNTQKQQQDHHHRSPLHYKHNGTREARPGHY